MQSFSGRLRAVESGTILGRYEVADELGVGGMATVFLAHDTELRRDVAIKVLFPHLCKKREVVARFQREARAAASLDHPHILRVYDVGGGPLARPADDGPMDPPYIVLELVRGGSLREFASTHGPPLAEVVAAIGVALCSGLSEAHAAGIIHRDIKPANIMVAEAGRLVVSDFGVAHLDDDSSLVTRTGALLGTPAFMSPEQAHGAEVDQRSDVYSLGATLYRVATGSMPFSGPTPRVVAAISRGELRPPLQLNPTMGRELARVIERMMAIDVDTRYASAKHAAADLQQLVDNAELGEADDVLSEYFADPDAFAKAHTTAIVATTLERARDAVAARRIPVAIALVDRVLALDADNSEALALVDQMGRGQRRWQLSMAALAIIVVAGAAYLGYSWLTNDAKTQRSAVVVYDAAPSPTDAAGAGAHDAATTVQVVDVQLADASAVMPMPIDARRRRVVVRPPPPRYVDAAAAVADAAVVAKVPVDAAAPVAAKLATVYFQMDRWCNITINRVSYGRAKRGRAIAIKAGRYAMVCSQGAGMATWRRTVTLAAGERRILTGSLLSSVRVGISVSRGDRIHIQGKGSYRNGVRLLLPAGRYRIELRTETRTIQATWLTIPPVGACTIRDKPALDCYR